MNKYILKRDGRKVAFRSENILNVVKKVLNSVHPDDTLSKSEEQLAETLTKDIILDVQKKLDPPTVEGVQDIVQDVLIKNSLFNEAKNFIEYRTKRTAAREFNDDITKTYRKMSKSSSKDVDLMRENANINGDATMGLMLRFGSEACKDYITKYILKPEWTFAHKNGDFHMHDLDFSRLCWNCCQIDLTKLFHHGFSTGHGYLREPSNIRTASALACIALQSNQNDMFGGQSIAKFDYDLAPYVAKTFAINLCKVIEDIQRVELSTNSQKEIKNLIWSLYNKLNSVTKNTIFGQSLDSLKSIIAKYVKSGDVDYVYNRTLKLTDIDTFQAMEALVHNLNTMQSRAGAQTPFSSINYGTCTTEEGRLVIKNILLATEKGLGRGETPIFPVQVFKMKKGVNYNKGEPNFDLFELACRVTAKRLFPNFSYIDAPQNLQYYKEGRPETELAVMGAARGDETVTIKIENTIYNDIKIEHAFKMIRDYTTQKNRGHNNIEIPELKGWKKPGIYKITHIPTGHYYIGSSKNVKRRIIEHRVSIRHFGSLGEWYNIGDRDLNNYKFEFLMDSNPDFLWENENKFIDLNDPLCVNHKSPLNNGNFITGSNRSYRAMNHESYSDIDNSMKASCWMKDVRGGDVYVLSRGQFEPILSIIHNNTYSPLKLFEIGFRNQKLYITEDHPLHTKRGRVEAKDLKVGDIIYDSKTFDEITITSVKVTDQKVDTYDFEVSNDLFDLSGIISHNCRTRTIANAVHPEDAVVTGRGNFSFTTINLPRLGIECKGNWKAFYTKLDNLMQLAREQLKERFENICKKHVYNYPFLLGQGVWIHSENLKPTDEVRKILDQCSISIGFIGLAECLKAMTGKHHGESEESNRLGHEILDHMNKNLSRYTKEDNLNWSLFATPAEGLSGRFVKIDAKRYGKIPGVTDRAYYTNSFHVPVYYNISAEDKIRIEGPYHEQCNAGSISYVEVDGDPSNNIPALEKLVKYAGECNMNYFSINHPVDRCPVCGYTGIINDRCPVCGRKEFEAVSIEKLRSCGCDTNCFE